MRPLEDYLVIDFSQFLSGPSASLRLADMGARVIKIERLGVGDICRTLYTSNLIMNGESSVFHAINRNKESFEVDLKNQDDCDMVLELLKKADVMIHNFRPGVMQRLGFDYQSVSAINPKIIYGEISGFGNEESEWRNKPGQDLLLQSVTGLTSLTGNANSGPVAMGLSIVDMLTGAHLAQGLLASLYRSAINNQGAFVQVSMLESAYDFQFETITTFMNDGGELPERSAKNNANAYLGAPYGIYQTQDGYLALAMGSIRMLGNLLGCNAISVYQNVAEAFDKRDEIKTILAEHLLNGTTESWLAKLEPADIWCADVLNWQQLLEHDGFKVLDMIQEVEMLDGYKYETTRCPIRIDGELLTSTKGSPQLGQDNDKIIKEFNLKSIASLPASKQVHNSTDIFRIAVRKFAPFETAMQLFWDKYCQFSGCKLKLDMVVMDLHELHERTLTNDGLANGDFDIAHINTDWIYEGFVNNAFEVLNDKIEQNPPVNYPEGWSKSLLGLQNFDGQIVGLPFHDGPECLIYRKDLFEDQQEQENYQAKYGKKLNVPQTWDDFKNVAEFFHRPAQNLYGSIFACYPDGHNTVFDFCLQLWTRGGTLLDENGAININTTAAVEGLSFYRNFVKDKNLVHPNSANFESVAAGLAFMNGEAAMMINWFGFAAMCEIDDNSKVKGKIEIDLLPSGIDEKSASLNVYWLYTIGKGSKNKAIAYDFLRFVTNPENDKLLTQTGGIGCRISTWNDSEINQQISFYHKLDTLHTVAKTLPQKANWARIAGVIDEMVLSAVNSSTTTEELIIIAQQKIDELEK